MSVLEKSDDAKVREVDKEVKNKFRWDWLDKKITLQMKKGDMTVTLSDSIQKIDIPGKAKCNLCSHIIEYGGRGWNALASHLKSSKHKELLELRNTNYALNSGLLCSQDLPSTSAQPQPSIPLSARVLNSQATILGFMAEHNLQFSLSPHLISLSKELARDPKALSSLSMDRTSASIKMRFGLAESLLSETLDNIRSVPFSLNIDEATSNNYQRVLSILVSYYSENQQRVVVEHLSSIKLYTVNSKSVYNAVHSLMIDNNIPYTNLVSIMMDSCAIMRGSKSGLETQIRQKHAPHLLDVDGDSCHHIHNASKKFSKEFDYHVEGLFSDLNTDFRWSSVYKLKLEQICEILGIKFSVPERYLSHRWLSCYDVAVETMRMWDVLTIFYFSFLVGEDVKTYNPIILNTYKKRNLNAEKIKHLKIAQEELKVVKPSTTEGKNRRQRLIGKLFYLRKKTLLHMQVYSAIFPLLKKYVCMFQSTEPLIHKLHDEQLAVFRIFLSCFIKPEALKAKPIVSNSLIVPENMLPDKQLFIGFGASGTLSKCNKTISKEFYESLRKAFISCGGYLKKKLPLQNSLLISVSALNPSEKCKTETLKKLELLPTIVSNVLSNADLENYMLEIRAYQIDNLPPFEEAQRLDEWWSSVFNVKEYPSLSKLVKAIISIFHGPAVESSFSSMNYIIDQRSGRMDIKTYSAIQTVKTSLKAKNVSALDYFHRNNIRYDPIKSTLCKNLQTSNKRYRDEKLAAMPEKSKMLKKTAAQTLLKNVEAAALKSHKSKQQLSGEKRKVREEEDVGGITEVKTKKLISETEEVSKKPDAEKISQMLPKKTETNRKIQKNSTSNKQKELFKQFFQVHKKYIMYNNL